MARRESFSTFNENRLNTLDKLITVSKPQTHEVYESLINLAVYVQSKLLSRNSSSEKPESIRTTILQDYDQNQLLEYPITSKTNTILWCNVKAPDPSNQQV